MYIYDIVDVDDIPTGQHTSIVVMWLPVPEWEPIYITTALVRKSWTPIDWGAFARFPQSRRQQDHPDVQTPVLLGFHTSYR
jgi:hypothetical protein